MSDYSDLSRRDKQHPPQEILKRANSSHGEYDLASTGLVSCVYVGSVLVVPNAEWIEVNDRSRDSKVIHAGGTIQITEIHPRFGAKCVYAPPAGDNRGGTHAPEGAEFYIQDIYNLENWPAEVKRLSDRAARKQEAIQTILSISEKGALDETNSKKGKASVEVPEHQWITAETCSDWWWDKSSAILPGGRVQKLGRDPEFGVLCAYSRPEGETGPTLAPDGALLFISRFELIFWQIRSGFSKIATGIQNLFKPRENGEK